MALLTSLIDSEKPGRQTCLFDAGHGKVELVVDVPESAWQGIALIAHPQPLLGGSAQHKIPFNLARMLCNKGWLAVRPNFRGVGESDGEHDQGDGESDDLLRVADALRRTWPTLPLALIGFSFGAFVQSRVAQALEEKQRPAEHVVLLGLPVGLVPDGRFYATPRIGVGTMLIHGEEDDRAPLALLSQHVRQPPVPIVMVPGADHFFSKNLPLILALVRQEVVQG